MREKTITRNSPENKITEKEGVRGIEGVGAEIPV